MPTVSARIEKLERKETAQKGLRGSLRHHLRARIPGYVKDVPEGERGTWRTFLDKNVGLPEHLIQDAKAAMFEADTLHGGLMMSLDESAKRHPANWKPFLDGVITFSPDADNYPTDTELHQMALRLTQDYLGGSYIMSAVHHDEKTVHIHWMAHNETPDGKALSITRETLSGMQTWASNWLKEKGYDFDRGAETYANGEVRAQHQSVRESHAIEAAKLAKKRTELEADIAARQAGKTTLEEDLKNLRDEAQDMRTGMQEMEAAMQETALAVGVYEHALKENRRPPVPVHADGLRRAQEYAKSRAGQHPGMRLMQRVLQRDDASALLGGLVILNPALVAGLVVAALAVVAYRNGEKSRTVGAAPTPPAENRNEVSRRGGLEEMVAEMVQQVQEALRAIEGLNARMDTLEQRMNNERQQQDAAPVVMRVREDTWTAELRENGYVYIRKGEQVMERSEMALDPRPTRDEATAALTGILRRCRREREVPGTPAIPTPADDCLIAAEIER